MAVGGDTGSRVPHASHVFGDKEKLDLNFEFI